MSPVASSGATMSCTDIVVDGDVGTVRDPYC
ncbi:uncharacterized protein METZ01_LOCUS133693 [marine metagenome]|uniref:Uncharacterized protein n=1 Tax=marine metagenome TaxID=408172 RepID=A0A381YV39_9ZZZZ